MNNETLITLRGRYERPQNIQPTIYILKVWLFMISYVDSRLIFQRCFIHVQWQETNFVFRDKRLTQHIFLALHLSVNYNFCSLNRSYTIVYRTLVACFMRKVKHDHCCFFYWRTNDRNIKCLDIFFLFSRRIYLILTDVCSTSFPLRKKLKTTNAFNWNYFFVKTIL